MAVDSLGENGHYFIHSAGRDRLAPVVGLGVVELVQVFDCGADSAERAEQHMANGFGRVLYFVWRNGVGRCAF